MSTLERLGWALALLIVLFVGGGGALALGGGGMFPDRIVAWKDGTALEYVPVGAPASATPTSWWTATSTPTLIPTNTPRPTSTPVPVSATPTQETVTWTPVPTGMPPTNCWIKNVDYTINLRAEPRTTAPIVEHVRRGATQELLAAQEGTQGYGYLWARTFVNGMGGWFVIRQYGNWWVYSLGAETQACVDLAGWPDGELPPPISPDPPTPTLPPVVGRPALGPHIVPGANRDEARQFYAAMTAKGIRPVAKVVNEPQACRDVQAAGGICVFRSVHPHDCPPLPSGVPSIPDPDPRETARYWLNAVAPYVLAQGVTPDYVELTNECAMDRLDWWNAFMLEAVSEAQRRGWPPLVLPTLPPGHGDGTMIHALRPALEALHDAGGCFGMHAYNDINNPDEVRLVDGTIWVAYRHRLIHAAMVGEGLGDVPICITEAARGNGGLPPDEADFAQWYKSIESDRYVRLVAMWTMGTTGAWPEANLNGHMLRIAELVE